MKKLKAGDSRAGSTHLLIAAVCGQAVGQAGICSGAHIGNVGNAAYYVCLSVIACKS